jgi:hypothetical protein
MCIIFLYNFTSKYFFVPKIFFRSDICLAIYKQDGQIKENTSVFAQSGLLFVIFQAKVQNCDQCYFKIPLSNLIKIRSAVLEALYAEIWKRENDRHGRLDMRIFAVFNGYRAKVLTTCDTGRCVHVRCYRS